MANFIPSFHFDHPDSKLTPEWCSKVKNYYYYNSGRNNLLKGKNISKIEQYWSGDIEMLPFKRMFKSMRKRLDNMQTRKADGTLNDMAANLDTIGLSWEDPLALLPAIMNSAIANIMKVPVDAVVVAGDALAMKKIREDLNFLKNKPEVESDLQEVADQLDVGKVDIGATKHSSIKYKFAPAGLDLNDPNDEETFVKLFYSLRVQTAFEKALKQIYKLKKCDIVRRKFVEDQFKWGVTCGGVYSSSITGLPELEYIHPSRVEVPESELADFGDRTHEVIDYSITVEEMFNLFSDEIDGEAELHKIINGAGSGYCDCNKRSSVDEKNFSTFRVNLKRISVKSVDWIGIKEKKKSKNGNLMFTMDEEQATSKIWAQNTYSFYWLINTNHYFRIEKIDGSFREPGNEAYQTFPTVIYRSQKKSATELSIQSNKKAIIADIKMQHALIKSLPPGKYIDLRFLRNALKGLKQENSAYTIDDLLALVFEQNHFIGDTEGFDGKNDGQIKPFYDLPGGLKNEIGGYIQTILNESNNISNLVTGINKNFTGQSSEELVGLQELQINSGLNAIDYCSEAIKHILEVVNNVWAILIQDAIERGGKFKQGVIDMIGIEDTDLLDALNESPLHKLTAGVNIGQRLKELQAVERQINFLKSKNSISTVEEYLLSGIDNVREKMQKLYLFEERFRRQEEKKQQAAFAQQQQLVKQNNEAMLQGKQMDGQQEINAINAKAANDAKIKELAHRLNLTEKQVDGIIQKALQKERNDGQTEKGIRTIQAKKAADLQSAL